ncbi:hypothetical protein ACWGDE_13700 [Streptomyces sp. NPDC054956]
MLPFIRRPEAAAALAGLVMAGLVMAGLVMAARPTIVPATARSTSHREKPSPTGANGSGAAPSVT